MRTGAQGRCRPAAGFTLIELLVAMFLMAILGTASFQMLVQINRAREVVTLQADRLAELQRTFYWMAEDISQISDRGVRSAIDSELLPFQLNIEGANLFELTRAGWDNPAAEIAPPRSTLQRVAWGLDGDRLMRQYWYNLETTSEDANRRRQMLTGVQDLTLRFIDDEGNFRDTWPPIDSEAPGQPRAIEFTLQLDDFGEVRRVFALPN